MEIIGAAGELAAVNELLAAIGEDPLEELANMPPSGHTALSVLRGTARDFQQAAYWFNYETDYELKPDALTKEIILPPHILNVDSMEGDCIQRGNRLYNKEKKTYLFEKPVQCDVILHLPWAELPAVVRRYITALSVEKFIEGFPAAQGTTEARLRNLLRAKVAFDKATIENGDYNILKNISIQSKMRRS